VFSCLKWVERSGYPELLMMDLNSLQKNKFVCNQHFQLNDFLQEDVLKSCAIPMPVKGSFSLKKIHRSDDKTVITISYDTLPKKEVHLSLKNKDFPCLPTKWIPDSDKSKFVKDLKTNIVPKEDLFNSVSLKIKIPEDVTFVGKSIPCISEMSLIPGKKVLGYLKSNPSTPNVRPIAQPDKIVVRPFYLSNGICNESKTMGNMVSSDTSCKAVQVDSKKRKVITHEFELKKDSNMKRILRISMHPINREKGNTSIKKDTKELKNSGQRVLYCANDELINSPFGTAKIVTDNRASLQTLPSNEKTNTTYKATTGTNLLVDTNSSNVKSITNENMNVNNFDINIPGVESTSLSSCVLNAASQFQSANPHTTGCFVMAPTSQQTNYTVLPPGILYKLPDTQTPCFTTNSASFLNPSTTDQMDCNGKFHFVSKITLLKCIDSGA
jgi:hypothetical protein